MPIEFRCGECGNLLRTPDGSGGKTGQCPSCNATMKIPESSQPADSTSSSTPTDAPFEALPSGTAGQKDVDERWTKTPQTEPLDTKSSEFSHESQPEKERESAAPQQPAPDYYAPSSPYGPQSSHPSADAYRPRFAGKPHKAPIIFTFALLGLLLSFVGCCPSVCTAPFTVIGAVLGLIATILGHLDLKEIEAGTMDPQGRDLTQAGYWIGIVCCALFVLKILVVIGVVVFSMIMSIANQA